MGYGLPDISRWDWRTFVVSLATMTVVVLGSIGVVRFRNRDRAVTQAVIWAADALANIPDSAIAGAFPIQDFDRSRRRFTSQLRDGELPVDSVRAFYQAYALCARDGIISGDEVRQFGAFLGLSSVAEIPKGGQDTSH